MSDNINPMLVTEIENLKVRMNGVEKRFDKLDNSMEKMWNKIDLYREGQVITQTLLTETRKDMASMRVDMSKIYEKVSEDKEKNSTRWEQFWSKGFWFLVGIAGTIATTMLIMRIH